MKQSIVNGRFPKTLSTLIEREKDKTALIEETLKASDLKCPSCQKLWPKKDEPPKKNHSFRIHDETYKEISKLAEVSKFLAVNLMVRLGICPVCERKK